MPFPLLLQKVTRVIFLLFCGWAAFFSFLSVEAKAQSLSAHSDFVIDQWDTGDGLPVNSVNRVIQSQDGYLWMATFDGLVRFDGLQFKVFEASVYPGLPSNRILDITEAQDGSLWMETEQSFLVRYRNGEFKHIRPEDGYNGSLVHTLIKDSEGIIWMGSEQGITQYKNGMLSAFEPNRIKGVIDRLYVQQNGAVWFRDHQNNTVYRFFNDSLTLMTHTRTAYDIVPFAETGDTLWLGTGNGLYRFANHELTLASDFFTGDAEPYYLSEAVEGYVKAATKADGLYGYDNENPNPLLKNHQFLTAPFYTDGSGDQWLISAHHIYYNDRLVYQSKPAITDFLFDREGNLWLTTYNEGLYRLKPNPFTIYSEEEGLPDDNIYPVMEARDGSVWVGTHGSGAVRIKDGEVDASYLPVGNEGPAYVRTLGQIKDGSILMGLSGGGVWQLRNDAFYRYPSPRALRTATVASLFEDSRGGLWVGSARGLYLLENGSWTLFDTRRGFPYHVVRFITEAPDGSLWMATNGAGIAHYKAGEFVFFGIDEGLGSNLVRSLHIEPGEGKQDYVLWVGTEDRGLIRLKVEQGVPQLQDKTVYGTNAGMLDYVIHVILKDDDDNFWFNTNRGIFTVPHKELEAFHKGEISTIKGTSYTENDGLRNREGNGGMQPAGIKASDGQLWLPGQDGLVVLNPLEIKNNKMLPPMVIESLQTVDDELPIASGKEIELSAGQRDFEFNYTALSLVASEKNTFRYRLAGYNDAWIDAGSRRTATYTNIPAGSYTFEVQGSNNTGNWNPEAATVPLNVAPFFYETTAFRLSILFVILLLSYGGMRWRVRILEQNKLTLEKLVNERTRQLSREKQKTEEQAERLKELDKAKSRFFTNISHEFRTPLTLIISPLQGLLSSGISEFKPATQKIFKRMLRNSDRLLRLIDQTLELTRLEHGKLKLHVGEIELNDFLGGLTELFEPICDEKDIQLQFVSEDGECSIFADPGKLDKMVANLISNAVKFTPAGGNISVTLRQLEKWAEVEVTDTGIGISKSEQEKIFNRFYQVDSSETRHHEGSGVGLSLARDFAELHHGSLSVKSELNSGTSFLLRLKKGDRHFTEEEKSHKKDDYRLQQAPAFSASNGEEVDGEDKTKILVVEDNADLRAFIREVFTGRYTVIEASNGAEAIKQVSEDLPDLIIADIMMPKMDGIAFNRELKKNPATASIPLIFLTAKSTRENKITGLSDGADDYITKPFDPEILKARVQNLIESRFRLRSLLAKERREAASEISKTSADPFLEKVEKILSVNYTDPDFNVTKLVEKLFLDRSQVLRKLKSITGLSPSEYIKKYRMEEASRLLHQEAGTVSEVAYGVGYKSLSYFSYTFKEYFETTPSAYVESES